MKKICTKCYEEKELDDFHKKCDSKDGYRTSCKVCCNKDATERRKVADKNKVQEYRLDYYDKNKQKILQNKKEYYIKNQDSILEKKAVYRKENPEIQKNWRNNNPNYMSEYNKNYRENNKQYFNLYMQEWRDKNPHIVIWRGLVYRTINYFNTIKESHTIDILGYSALDLKLHLEKQFLHDMNWDNYGDLWEVDHIYPLSKFNPDTSVNVVNALENLRPLYSYLNSEKKAKIIDGTEYLNSL